MLTAVFDVDEWNKASTINQSFFCLYKYTIIQKDVQKTKIKRQTKRKSNNL